MTRMAAAPVGEAVTDTEAMGVVDAYRRARDDYHDARARLAAVESHGRRLAVWLARSRYRAALNDFSQVGERLTVLTVTHPALIAKVMHTL